MRTLLLGAARGARRLCALAVLPILVATAMPAHGQTTPDAAPSFEAAIAAAVAEAKPGPPATLMYANRPIVQLRSSVLDRLPSERVAAATVTLDRLIESGITGPVQTRPLGPAVVLEVGGRRIVAILPVDVDALAGETPQSVGTTAAARLQVALDEVTELRRPRHLLRVSAEFLGGMLLFGGLFWLLRRGRVAADARISRAANRLQATWIQDAEFVASSRMMEMPRRLVTAITWVLGLFLAYSWLTFTLRRFPYTRPWGESLRSFLLGELSSIGLAIMRALPGLFTVLLILLITRVVTRIVHALFVAFEEGRVTLPWIYAETAQPTRRLLTAALWLFAVVLAYPYLPGSGSDAFKGMSVFIGLVVSLGSTGIMNQMISGFMITYSRALRVGDIVVVSDVEGEVTQVGTLSTKIKTPKGEDVTIPNAVVVSNTVTNYSRFAESEGVFVATEITIGYDVPWRQVEALLLLAASRSEGVRRQPAPRVRPSKLEDAYIRYTLLFCPEDHATRRKVLATVHAHILDAFNEYSVQITSPVYENDPERLKVVPREQWFAAPARPEPQDAADVREVRIGVDVEASRPTSGRPRAGG